MSDERTQPCITPRIMALAYICGEPFDKDYPINVKGDLADGWALIDEVSDDLSYIGFPVLNPDQADPLCTILEVRTDSTGGTAVTTRKWSGGTMDQIYLWSNRLILDYFFLT